MLLPERLLLLSLLSAGLCLAKPSPQRDDDDNAIEHTDKCDRFEFQEFLGEQASEQTGTFWVLDLTCYCVYFCICH